LTTQQITDAISDAATQGISQATGPTGSVTQHSLNDRIAAAEFAAANKPRTKGKKPFRIMRVENPGATN
jgi:hypothetical protein